MVPFGDDEECQFRVPLLFQSNAVSLPFLQFGKGLCTDVKNLGLFFVQDHTVLALADSVSVERILSGSFLFHFRLFLRGSVLAALYRATTRSLIMRVKSEIY